MPVPFTRTRPTHHLRRGLRLLAGFETLQRSIFELSRTSLRSPEPAETDILLLPNIDMGVTIPSESGSSVPQTKNASRLYLLQMAYQPIDPSHGYCTPWP